jgi:seryl-tRNA synthetase
MLDRNLVANNASLVRDHLARRNASDEQLSDLERLVTVIARRRQLQTETDGLRADRKRISKSIGPLMKAGKREEAQPLRDQVGEIASTLDQLEQERKQLSEEEEQLLLSFPNLLDDRVPLGTDEESNQLIETWGAPKEFDFEPIEHHTLAENLGLYDAERAAKIAGTRFSVLKGDLALMERALINFFLDEASQSGYQEVLVPYIVNSASMTGTGQLPKFEEDLFKLTTEIGGLDGYLIPTAEVPVTNLHRDEIINEADLPINYCSFTPCFRAEAGSYGKDTHGLIRQHQFHKVELVKITTPQTSDQEHHNLTRHSQNLLEKLRLPYRLVRLCGGDVGFGAYHCYDLEVWLPGQGKYREISSCSNFGDFQARRMKLRYRPDGGGKPVSCHTINGSALAVGRTLVAIIENYQQKDGTIAIPEVLQSYMRGKQKIT